MKTICGVAIDWSATGDIMAGTGALIGAGAVIYAAHKAADTFTSWRKQKHHERCMIVAEDILTLAYKLKRAFQGIRSPGMLANEIAEVEGKLRENGLLNDDTPHGHKSVLTTAQATMSRTEHNRPLFEALLDKVPVAKAVFGDDVAEWMNVLWVQRAKVVTAAGAYARSIHDRELRRVEDEQARQDRYDRTEGVIWEGGGMDGHDHVAEAIDDAIGNLERVLLPIIRNNPD